jgi:hypothetical protein
VIPLTVVFPGIGAFFKDLVTLVVELNDLAAAAPENLLEAIGLV